MKSLDLDELASLYEMGNVDQYKISAILSKRHKKQISHNRISTAITKARNAGDPRFPFLTRKGANRGNFLSTRKRCKHNEVAKTCTRCAAQGSVK